MSHQETAVAEKTPSQSALAALAAIAAIEAEAAAKKKAAMAVFIGPLVAKALAFTQRVYFDGVRADGPAYSPKVSALVDKLAKSDFGCQACNVVEILSIVVDAPELPAAVAAKKLLRSDELDVMLCPGLLLVPMNDKGSHSYPLNVPALTTDRYDSGRRGVTAHRADGSVGNFLYRYKGQHRLPSREEAEAFFTQLLTAKPELLEKVEGYYAEVPPDAA